MAEAIDSSLFFSVPTGWMQQYKIGVFGVLYGWNREFRESEHNAREGYPGGHLLRRDRENSKLYFCAHKSVTAYSEEVGERAQLRQEPGEAKSEFFKSAIRTRETKRTKSEQREKAQ